MVRPPLPFALHRHQDSWVISLTRTKRVASQTGSQQPQILARTRPLTSLFLQLGTRFGHLRHHPATPCVCLQGMIDAYAQAALDSADWAEATCTIK
jgi:hypothetical protein